LTRYPEYRGARGTLWESADAAELVPLISYEHVQGASSAIWTVDHYLGFYPSVSVFDSALTEVEGAIEHQDVNSLTITFSVSISGTAYLS
jgi:hypothetical protein